MMMEKLDPKKKVLDELMSYLDEKDGEELGSAIQPKGMGLEVTKIEKLGDVDDSQPIEAEVLGEKSEEASPQMSEEEISELIEAIQSKLGS